MTNFKEIMFTVAASLLAAAVPARATDEYVVEKDKSRAEFLAVGKPGFLKIKGTGATVSGSVQRDGKNLSGALSAQTADFNTGIDMRDKHMHEKYLDTKTYPTSTLALQKVTFESGDSGKCAFTGQLTIKGVTKPVSGDCDVSDLNASQIFVTASTQVPLSEFPIGVPSHLGIKVADTVTITVDLKALKTKK